MGHASLLDCPLCQTAGGLLLWQGPQFRVIDAADPAYPGFTRIVWTAHVVEMTDLSAPEQTALMRAVFLVESVQRNILQPHKINLAAMSSHIYIGTSFHAGKTICISPPPFGPQHRSTTQPRTRRSTPARQRLPRVYLPTI